MYYVEKNVLLPVRSLASIALRKAVNSRSPFHFDYFSIDLNEELSGLNGALLTEQLRYVNASLFRVLDLYKNRPIAPKSIILFGHSMVSTYNLYFNPEKPIWKCCNSSQFFYQINFYLFIKSKELFNI